MLIWLLLCCLKSLLFVKVFPHISQLNYVTSALWLYITNSFLCLRYIFFGSISTLFTINLVRFWSNVYHEFWSYVSCWYFHMFHSWYFQWYFFHVQCLCNISCFCSNFEFIFCYFRYILFVWVIPHISQVYYHLCFSTFTVWAKYQVEFWNNTGMCSVYIITMFTLKHHIWNPDSICF